MQLFSLEDLNPAQSTRANCQDGSPIARTSNILPLVLQLDRMPLWSQAKTAFLPRACSQETLAVGGMTEESETARSERERKRSPVGPPARTPHFRDIQGQKPYVRTEFPKDSG